MVFCCFEWCTKWRERSRKDDKSSPIKKKHKKHSRFQYDKLKSKFDLPKSREKERNKPREKIKSKLKKSNEVEKGSKKGADKGDVQTEVHQKIEKYLRSQHSELDKGRKIRKGVKKSKEKPVQKDKSKFLSRDQSQSKESRSKSSSPDKSGSEEEIEAKTHSKDRDKSKSPESQDEKHLKSDLKSKAPSREEIKTESFISAISRETFPIKDEIKDKSSTNDLSGETSLKKEEIKDKSSTNDLSRETPPKKEEIKDKSSTNDLSRETSPKKEEIPAKSSTKALIQETSPIRDEIKAKSPIKDKSKSKSSSRDPERHRSKDHRKHRAKDHGKHRSRDHEKRRPKDQRHKKAKEQDTESVKKRDDKKRQKNKSRVTNESFHTTMHYNYIISQPPAITQPTHLYNITPAPPQQNGALVIPKQQPGFYLPTTPQQPAIVSPPNDQVPPTKQLPKTQDKETNVESVQEKSPEKLTPAVSGSGKIPRQIPIIKLENMSDLLEIENLPGQDVSKVPKEEKSESVKEKSESLKGNLRTKSHMEIPKNVLTKLMAKLEIGPKIAEKSTDKEEMELKKKRKTSQTPSLVKTEDFSVSGEFGTKSLPSVHSKMSLEDATRDAAMKGGESFDSLGSNIFNPNTSISGFTKRDLYLRKWKKSARMGHKDALTNIIKKFRETANAVVKKNPSITKTLKSTNISNTDVSKSTSFVLHKPK